MGVVTVEEGNNDNNDNNGHDGGRNKGASEGSFDESPKYSSGLVYQDLNGHGTHCAGIIAGKSYGVAKRHGLLQSRFLRPMVVGRLKVCCRGLSG